MHDAVGEGRSGHINPGIVEGETGLLDESSAHGLALCTHRSNVRRRRAAFLRKRPTRPTPPCRPGRIDTDVAGPGFAATWFTGLVDTLLLGCATPTGPGSCELRFSFVVRQAGDAESTTALGRAFIEEIHERTVEDVEVWENKAYVPLPALAHGDGPIMQYRRWCEQFYAEGVDGSRELAVPEEPVAAAPVAQPASEARVTAAAAARMICLNILSVSVVVLMVVEWACQDCPRTCARPGPGCWFSLGKKEGLENQALSRP